MLHFLLSLQFLTRYPVSISGAELNDRDFGRSTRFYPLAGFLVGLDLCFFRWLLQWAGVLEHWPLAAAALLLAYWVWACDSLHLDGLADTADGLASGQRGEAMLEIMHDGRNGAFGVQALALVLLLKFSFLASLPSHFWWALPLPLLFSRLLAALLCQSRPYGGRPGSLSAWFILGAEAEDAGVALAWAFGGFSLLAGVAVLNGWASAQQGLQALGVCLGAMLAAYGLVQVPRRRLGGISGDLIGYAIEACELCACFGLLFLGL